MSNNSYWLIIYIVAFIAIFYFLAIRPQQKQRKAHQALLSSLKKGDRIMTTSGIYGTVKRVEDNLVVVEIAKGVAIKMSRRAIADIIRDSAEARAVAPEGPFGGKSKQNKEDSQGPSASDVEPEGSEESSESDEDIWSDNVWKKDK
ncbi:MAG: preprotein translocase subunit YajC [Thermoleophilia bacterium]|nr:preprotein translocase subunit YajC [Thermoleophilia bacterium]